MIIQINTDNNLNVHEAFGNKLDGLLAEELKRFSEHITRLVVHLFSDENGSKHVLNDKKCLLEARLEGRQPNAVSMVANDYERTRSNW